MAGRSPAIFFTSVISTKPRRVAAFKRVKSRSSQDFTRSCVADVSTTQTSYLARCHRHVIKKIQQKLCQFGNGHMDVLVLGENGLVSSKRFQFSRARLKHFANTALRLTDSRGFMATQRRKNQCVYPNTFFQY